MRSCVEKGDVLGWTPSLLVCYKLNRFRPPRIELVWYLCTVVWQIYQVCTVRLNGILWLLETFLKAVHRRHSYLWHCFCCVMDSYCNLLNFPLVIIIIAPCCYVCFCYYLSGWSNIIFLTPNYWRNICTSCPVTSVRKF